MCCSAKNDRDMVMVLSKYICQVYTTINTNKWASEESVNNKEGDATRCDVMREGRCSHFEREVWDCSVENDNTFTVACLRYYVCNTQPCPTIQWEKNKAFKRKTSRYRRLQMTASHLWLPMALNSSQRICSSRPRGIVRCLAIKYNRWLMAWFRMSCRRVS